MDEAGDGGGQGGGEAGADDVKTLKEQNAALLAKLTALEGKAKKDDVDLADKARLQREEQEKTTSNTKALESAIKFDMASKDWLKTNQSLLPKTVEGIFEAANKERYDSPIEKDRAIKVGVVSEFFAVQANLDLLTESQKIALAEFQALTKNDKQARAQNIYDNLFEPVLDNLKRVKKAEQLNRGLANDDDGKAAYKNRLLQGSKKHYLGDK